MESANIGNKYVGMDTTMLMEMAHSKHASELEKNAAVSQQFESVLVKQFLKEDFSENLIIGRRKKRKDHLIRLIITNFMKLIILIFHGVVVKDANSPFRLIKKSFLSKNFTSLSAIKTFFIIFPISIIPLVYEIGCIHCEPT